MVEHNVEETKYGETELIDAKDKGSNPPLSMRDSSR